MKTLLKNALIYDGSGEKPYKSDILFVGEKIAQVEKNLIAEDATVLELNGLSLSSGFIDAHSHNDWFAIKKEPLKYFELSIPRYFEPPVLFFRATIPVF